VPWRCENMKSRSYIEIVAILRCFCYSKKVDNLRNVAEIAVMYQISIEMEN